MRLEEYGKENEKIIVMLHGAHFVHSFGRQYPLADRYHIIVPHIMGFGDEADRVFDTEACVKELAQLVESLGKKVMLVGFSLGAQLGFKLLAEHEELFHGAVLVSPWLIKEEPMLSEIEKGNQKQLQQLKKRWLCNIIAVLNGLWPKVLRREFVEQMQRVKAETVRNVVYNGITLDSVPEFAGVTVPVVALAGEKEQAVIHDSVKQMAQLAKNCRCEIWEKAGHNIPPLFAGRFNQLLISEMSRDE